MPKHIETECPSKNIQLMMLKYALLEIRMTDDLSFSHKLADIFHNLPNLLITDWNDELCNRSYQQIIDKSRKNKLMKYILSLQATAEKQIKNN